MMNMNKVVSRKYKIDLIFLEGIPKLIKNTYKNEVDMARGYEEMADINLNMCEMYFSIESEVESNIKQVISGCEKSGCKKR